MRSRNSLRGFTLIEMMVVVAIIGILAAIAVPMDGEYVIRGKIAEATSALSNLRVQMEQFYQDNRNYGAAACGVTMPTGKYFTYTCAWGTSGNNQTYLLTATGSGGGMNGFAFTVDEANTQATTAVPAGWAQPNPNNCWVMKKSGGC